MISDFKLANLYVDGNPLRKLADDFCLSHQTVFRKVKGVLKSFPLNSSITQNYVDMSKYQGFLVVDGKYTSVNVYDRKIPFIWGIDYQTHDIPHFVLAPSENYVACVVFFSDLKRMGYKLRYLVCDDNSSIKEAARFVYPNAVIQTCVNHYLENIRKELCIRTDKTYRPFFCRIESMFVQRLCQAELVWEIAKIANGFGNDKNCSRWLERIMHDRYELTNYHMFENAPNTTNLNELYNSHANPRLVSTKGFQTFKSAKTFVNAYVVKRRIRKFTDCSAKFKHLNGKCSMQTVLKEGVRIGEIRNIINPK